MPFCPLSNQQAIYNTHTFSVSPYLTLSLFTSLSYFISWFQWRMRPLKTSQRDGVTNCSNRLGKFQTDSHPSSISPFSHPHLSPRDYLGERNLEWPVSPNRPGDIWQTAVEDDCALGCPAWIRDLLPVTHGCLRACVVRPTWQLKINSPRCFGMFMSASDFNRAALSTDVNQLVHIISIDHPAECSGWCIHGLSAYSPKTIDKMTLKHFIAPY